MPIRPIPFVTGEYYHLFNRGVAKQPIFTKPKHYLRFERILAYYNYPKPPIKYSRFLRLTPELQRNLLLAHRKKIQTYVEIIAYCLMPNHFHLLLRQLQDNGISNYLRLMGNSYTRYFNTVTNRVGPVFQGNFKSVLVESNSQLLHLSRYIHLNPFIANLVSLTDLSKYPHSSYAQYLKLTPAGTIIVHPKIILDQFKSTHHPYLQFVNDQADYGLTLNHLKHALFDHES